MSIDMMKLNCLNTHVPNDHMSLPKHRVNNVVYKNKMLKVKCIKVKC